MRYERIMQSIDQISASARALAAELMQEERQADRRERINGKPSRFERVEDPAAPNGYRRKGNNGSGKQNMLQQRQTVSMLNIRWSIPPLA